MKMNLERNNLIEQQNKKRGLNALVLYEVEKEGSESNIYLSDVPGMTPSEVLYLDAMEKLAQEIIEENIKVERIRKIFPAIGEESKMFENMGFKVVKINKFIAALTHKKGEEIKGAIASIGVDEFLHNFTKELATK